MDSKKMKLNPNLTSCTKFSSKWNKDLDIRPKTTEFLEESIGTKLLDIGLSNVFADLTPNAREIIIKIKRQLTE